MKLLSGKWAKGTCRANIGRDITIGKLFLRKGEQDRNSERETTRLRKAKRKKECQLRISW